MTSITEQLLKEFTPIDPQLVKLAFEKRLSYLGVENIVVDDVVVDYEGDLIVDFSDDEGGQVSILFTYDPDEGAIAMVLDDPDYEEHLIIDLDSLSPPLKQTIFGPYLDLTNLEWLSYSVLSTILQADDMIADVTDPEEEVLTFSPPKNDKYGFVTNEAYVIIEEGDAEFELDESRKISVIRGGKKVRLAVVRKVRKKVLTGKQKASIRKAVRKRKVMQAKINRKRKRSLTVRKRQSVKTPKLNKFQRVAGGANRKR
jgi:hypothetical protein